MINYAEMLVANATGVSVLFILLIFRFRNREQRQPADQLYDLMVAITFGALLLETLTFYIDGCSGTVFRVLQYASNGYLFLASSCVGMLWCFYVDYRIFHSMKRLYRRLIPLGLPFLVIAVLVVLDLFGMGNLFMINSDNIYVRGRLLFLSYGVVFFYYIYSIVLAVSAVQSNGHAQFFPVLYFVLPCIVGTIVQGLFYGLSVGWLGASLAFFFVQMQLQNFNAFVDDLSGLYNRRYYNYLLDKTVKSRNVKSISGIMIDVNHFKSINDQYGHTAGDDAIRSLGVILSEVNTERSTAFRLSGDEFVLLSPDLSPEGTEQLTCELQAAVERFNNRGEKPYKLSLAVGYSIFSTENFDSDQFMHIRWICRCMRPRPGIMPSMNSSCILPEPNKIISFSPAGKAVRSNKRCQKTMLI
ncbi:MAG: GGDEF domain-containing protein [Clostridiales bacterium]|nr:GGDEF domain-containing protein [Clostridiales bacterium]